MRYVDPCAKLKLVSPEYVLFDVTLPAIGSFQESQLLRLQLTAPHRVRACD